MVFITQTKEKQHDYSVLTQAQHQRHLNSGKKIEEGAIYVVLLEISKLASSITKTVFLTLFLLAL